MAGVMTLHDPWSITQTKRFKAAGIGPGITITVTVYGTQDIPSVVED